MSLLGNKYNHYTAFGLVFASEIPFPELCPSGKPADITISLANQNLAKDKDTANEFLIEMDSSSFLLCIPRVGEFSVKSGKDVLVYPYAGTGHQDLRAFLLSTCMAAMLLQRKLFPQHGNGLVKNGKGIIIGGLSGAGKSTISGQLLKQGYYFLSDDVCLPLPTADRPARIAPGYPFIKLWNDSIDLLGFTGMEKFKVREQVEKYKIKLDDEILVNDPVEFSMLFLLSKSTKQEIVTREITGMEKFNHLMFNSYRLRFVKHMNMSDDIFQWTGQVSKKLRVFVVEHPAKDQWYVETAKTIDRYVSEQ